MSEGQKKFIRPFIRSKRVIDFIEQFAASNDISTSEAITLLLINCADGQSQSQVIPERPPLRSLPDRTPAPIFQSASPVTSAPSLLDAISNCTLEDFG